MVPEKLFNWSSIYTSNNKINNDNKIIVKKMVIKLLKLINNEYILWVMIINIYNYEDEKL